MVGIRLIAGVTARIARPQTADHFFNLVKLKKPMFPWAFYLTQVNQRRIIPTLW